MDEALLVDGVPTDFVTQIVALHRDYYTRHWGFTAYFLDRVRAETDEFVRRFAPGRDLIARVHVNGELAGSLTIDGPDGANAAAHLRWFIVANGRRGRGIGNRLLATAVSFCRDHDYERIFLTTFAGLDPARHLYEKFGFTLTESRPGESWGTRVTEQRFELLLNEPA